MPHKPLKVNKEAMFFVNIQSTCPRFKTVDRPCPKGDVDNYAKAVLDVLTKWGGVWDDDNQVTVLTTTKVFVADGEEPHTTITIAEL
jgi:Holliday junction resolvase RusA-like endonuclease